MNKFIKSQQELARERIEEFCFEDIFSDAGAKEFDNLLNEFITQIIQNTGEELMRRASEEQKKHNCPPDDGNDYDQGSWEAIDTIKKHITNVTGVE